MGAVHITIQEYFDTISETVGIKSGILLDRHEIKEILLQEVDEKFITRNDLQAGIRIRSEVFDEHINIVRRSIGNVDGTLSDTFAITDVLMRLHEHGIDGLAILKTLVEVHPKSGEPELDPPEIILRVQKKIKASDDNIIAIAIALGKRLFASNFISQPERQSWDGGQKLSDLFSCELKPSSQKFLDQKFIDYLASNQEKLESIHWRNFERFCAEFFDSFGYRIDLGPGSNDGGVDIRVFDPNDLSAPLILIQCKRYSKGNKVQIETVKSFYTDVLFENAKHGMIVTTSSIAAGGKKVCSTRKYPLSFAENSEVKKWAASLWRFRR
jgi:restriction system protein